MLGKGAGKGFKIVFNFCEKLVDFLLVIIELFSLGAFDLSQFTRLTDGQTDGLSLIHI